MKILSALSLSLAVLLTSTVLRAQSTDSVLAIGKSLDDAYTQSNEKKADRYDEMLMSDCLHILYAAYVSDKKNAPRETKELAALKSDLNALDADPFPTIDPLYPDMVLKATTDFQKLEKLDKAIENELHN